jgi:hypothetical protein
VLRERIGNRREANVAPADARIDDGMLGNGALLVRENSVPNVDDLFFLASTTVSAMPSSE